VTRHGGGVGPTFEQVLAETWQRLEELGRVINDVRRALREVQSIHEQTHRAGADAGQSCATAEAVTRH
jgi:hypothetical protein